MLGRLFIVLVAAIIGLVTSPVAAKSPASPVVVGVEFGLGPRSSSLPRREVARHRPQTLRAPTHLLSPITRGSPLPERAS